MPNDGVGTGLFGYSAYPEPAIWFGDLPGRPISQAERRILVGEADGVETWVYNSGQVLTRTTDPVQAQSIVNHFFGVLSRSNFNQRSVPMFELNQIWNADADGRIAGATLSICARNYLLADLPEGHLLLQRTDEPVAAATLAETARIIGSPAQSRLAMRFFHATSLLLRGHLTESFVTSWSIIEMETARRFKEYWLGQGRSRRDVKEMDWTAAQQIDLLLATNDLDADEAAKLHGLRKRRNAIVHERRRISAGRRCLYPRRLSNVRHDGPEAAAGHRSSNPLTRRRPAP